MFSGLCRTVVVAAFAASTYSPQRLLDHKGFGRRECWKPTFPQEPSTTTCWYLGGVSGSHSHSRFCIRHMMMVYGTVR